MPVDLMLPPPDSSQDPECSTLYSWELRQCLRDVYELARVHLKAAAKRQKRRYDLGSADRLFKPGDYVWSRIQAFTKEERRLGPHWEGPYQVVKVRGDVTITIRAPGRRKKTIHVDNVKNFYGEPPFESLLEPLSREVSIQWDGGKDPSDGKTSHI